MDRVVKSMWRKKQYERELRKEEKVAKRQMFQVTLTLIVWKDKQTNVVHHNPRPPHPSHVEEISEQVNEI